MNRPYIFCHMMTSIDGKIMGSYMDTPEGEIAGDVFYSLAFGKEPYYKHQGWMCDELSVLITAAADGSSETPALFETRGGLASDQAVGFTLQSAEVKDGGSVWLRYLVKPSPKEVV